ncbi:TPA: BppU family phage baseplate upper protein [Clostridium perfringens]
MAKKDIKFTLDTIDSNYSPVGTVKQLDSVFFYIKITENGVTKDLTGQTIKLFAVKGDKKLVEQTTKINTTNETEGLVEIELLNSAIQVPGFTYFELEISDNTGIISTSDFILRVDRKVGSDEAIESTNEVATLKEIEIYVAQAKVELQRFKELQTEMLRTNETINSNEEGRVSAEEKRVNAENKRALAEEERGTLFTQKEEERGTLFAQKEVERDDTFAQGERERNERFEEAESDRAVAESERVIAEQVREEKFAGFESKISSNTKELKGARTATTGENFDTLDERIDCEIDRLNKKIEVSMLQQEDKENHVIENTVEGMTTDMVVKGMTLQNLWKTKSTSDAYWFKVKSNLSKLVNNDTITLIVNGIDLTKYRYRFGTINSESDAQYNVLKDYTQDRIVILNIGNSVNPSLDLPVRDCLWLSLYPLDSTVEISDRTIYSELKIIVLRGDYSNKPIPQYFEGIKSFGEQEDNKISILSHGKNLLKPPSSDITKRQGTCDITLTKDGGFIINGSNSTTGGGRHLFSDIYLYKVTKGVSYTLSCIHVSGTSTDQYSPTLFLTNINNHSDIPASINTTSSTKKTTFVADKDMILFCGVNVNIDQSYNNYEIKVMLEESKNVTQYETYKENKKDILLQNLGFDEGLRGLNLTVYDELNDIKKMAIKRIEKHTFTGNESISIRGEVKENTMSFAYAVKNNKSNALLCNNFKVLGGWDKDEERIWLDGTNLMFHIQKSKLTTLDANGFRAWLKANPTAIYYELAEPVETPLSENINLKTFNEKTYVSFENAISGTSSFKAPVNVAATISRLNRENRALEEENLKLKENMIETSKSLIEVDTNIIATNWEIDFRVCEVEWTLEDMGVESPVNLKIKKGVGNMALSRYEQAKIMILGGVYEKETLTRQLDAYLKRKYVSQEEYDELIALMEARDMVTNQ